MQIIFLSKFYHVEAFMHKNSLFSSCSLIDPKFIDMILNNFRVLHYIYFLLKILEVHAYIHGLCYGKVLIVNSIQSKVCFDSIFLNLEI